MDGGRTRMEKEKGGTIRRASDKYASYSLSPVSDQCGDRVSIQMRFSHINFVLLNSTFEKNILRNVLSQFSQERARQEFNTMLI